MFGRRVGCVLLICFFSLFIKQGLVAETDLSQRDGPFVIAGQVGAGLFGQSVGGLACAVSLLYAESLLFGKEYSSHVFGSPGFIYGGLAGAWVSSAATVYLIGETFGSGGGSFKQTLKWSPLTPIGATIGYQRSKNQFAETDLRQRDGLFVMANQVHVGTLSLIVGSIWEIGVGGTVSSIFTEDGEAFPPAEFFGGAIGGIFVSAVGTYAMGELYGSGSGSFKETLKWSFLTPIGGTIGYQWSKPEKPSSVSLDHRKLKFHPPMITIQRSQLPYRRLEIDYLVRVVNASF